MEEEELKRKLMGLWEKTTHNSKELMAVLFDYYFNEKYIEYKEIDGKIVSAICGIPYNFGYGSHNLKGLYLIPLTSEEGYRKKGILSELVNKFNQRLKEEFDFTFLVPHTELLADYFGSQDYLSSFFILEERFTPMHDFRNDYIMSVSDSDERIRDLKLGLLDRINADYYQDDSKLLADYIVGIEKKSTSAVNLCHTDRDIDYLLHPETITKFIPFVAFDEDGKITGAAFVQTEEYKRIKVSGIYVDDVCSYYALLDFIKREFSDYSMSVITSDPKYQTSALIQQTYVSANPKGGDLDNTISTVEVPFNINKLLQPLGMVRLLRFNNIMEFIANTHSDADFKIHIRDYNPDVYEREEERKDSDMQQDETKEVYLIKNGKCESQSLEDIKKDKSLLDLTKKEISELLLRKPDSNNLIMEAFGVPRLNLQIRLLPC